MLALTEIVSENLATIFIQKVPFPVNPLQLWTLKFKPFDIAGGNREFPEF